MSWTFIPSLIGCMLLMFGVVSIVEEDNVSAGLVLLTIGGAFMILWYWMVKREGRG